VGAISATLLALNLALWNEYLRKITENKETVMISIWWIILPIGIICGTILVGIVFTRVLPQKDIEKELEKLKDRVTKLEQNSQVSSN
jgi:uncharacterized membrane-anchored protein YhcB (DUF1043 family)